MIRSAWLIQRSILVIVLIIGFYSFALGLAALLLTVAYVITARGTGGIWIALSCFMGAAAILSALVPRRYGFRPPGPLLEADDEPHLFAFAKEIADRLGQRMPDEVYVTAEANVGVFERGGVAGFRSRRVMQIGTPLMQVLTVAEFRAVLAHEFGHYASHDVRLAPWIHRTRRAIARTVEDLDESFIGAPFSWYSRIFLRLTLAISRRQELIADMVSVGVAGRATVASALRRVNAVAPAYQLYFKRDVVPVLNAGYLPPVEEGFDHFLLTPRSQDYATMAIAEAERQPKAEPFDTHPSLSERLAAIGPIDPSAPIETGDRASSLLLYDYSDGLMRRTFGAKALDTLQPIAWPDVVTTVYVEYWKATTARCRPILYRLTFDRFPTNRQEFLTLCDYLHVNGLTDQRLGKVVGILGAAVGVRLLETGWEPVMLAGETPAFLKGETRFEPFDAIMSLANGTLTIDAWTARCAHVGLQGALVPLGDQPAEAIEPLDLSLEPKAPSLRSTRRRRQS